MTGDTAQVSASEPLQPAGHCARTSRRTRRFALLCAFVLLTSNVFGDAITGGGYANVAPAGFTFAAAADAPIVSASLNVYSDPDGLADITGTLTVEPATGFGQSQLDTGFVGMHVKGATAQTTYYARLTLDFGAGPVDFPSSTPLQPVVTSTPLAAREAGGVLLFNALTSAAAVSASSLSFLTLPTSPYALGSYTATGLHTYNLNNLKDTAGATLAVATGTTVTLQEWLGASCTARPSVARMRRVPDATGGGPALRVMTLTRCFFADGNCDNTVDVLDLQYLLGFFQTDAATCGFNDDLDANADGVVNILDLQALLNRFGDVAPF